MAFVLEKTLQYNDKEDFLKSEQHKKMLKDGKVFDTINYNDFVEIRIYKKEC